jgi:hypothetical protein
VAHAVKSAVSRWEGNRGYSADPIAGGINGKNERHRSARHGSPMSWRAAPSIVSIRHILLLEPETTGRAVLTAY